MHIRHLLRHRGRLAATATAAVLPVSLAWAGMATAGTAPQPSPLPAIKHVWVIELENEGLSQSFGDRAADPYLAVVLRRQGAFLKNYYAVGHNSLDNYVAQISGQAPDHATQNDCGVWTRFRPANVVEKPFDQLVGNGCVYPASIPTLGNQLSAAHWTWKAYLQDMGNQPARDHTTMTKQGPACGHPTVGKPDDTEGASAADQYATRHEGFMYFQSVTGNQAYCDAHILSSRPLPGDLTRASTTPAFSWISPNLCDDGHDAPCVTGAPGGLVQADAFLSQWVPKIMAAPAYRDGGLIVVTFDEGSDSAACCGEASGFSPDHPNVPLPGKNGPGGGRIGAVLLSPLIRPGTVSTVDYNHYSLLRTVEDIFGLPHLGDAAMPQVRSFGPDVFG